MRARPASASRRTSPRAGMPLRESAGPDCRVALSPLRAETLELAAQQLGAKLADERQLAAAHGHPVQVDLGEEQSLLHPRRLRNHFAERVDDVRAAPER